MNNDYFDILKQTIDTYDINADKYYGFHSDINEIKTVVDLFISLLTGKKVLDIGCGPGRDVQYFTQHGFNMVGIDLSCSFLKIAKANTPYVPFLKMDMRYLGFTDKSFDGLWVSGSFLHVPKPEALNTLHGFRKVLKDHGLMSLSVIQGKGEKMVPNKEYGGQSRFFAFYDMHEIEILIKKADFRIVKTQIVEAKDTWIDIYAKKGS